MYLARNNQLGTMFFYVPYWRQDRHFTWSSAEPREGLAHVCRVKAVLIFFFFLRLLGPAARIEPATSRIASSSKGQILWDYPPPPYSPPFPTSPPLRGLREQDRFFKGFLQAFFTRVSLNSGRPVCNFGVKKLTRRKSKRNTHTPGERGGEWRGEFILSC